VTDGRERAVGRHDTLTLVAYGAPALPLAALVLPVYVFLPQFYATQVGLGLSAVGTLLVLARLWDVATDPLIGVLSDRVATRFGRRRPWVVAGTPVVMLAVWHLFVPPDGAGPAHLLVWSLLLYVGWTMMILPLSAWGAELSPDYHERSRISAFREGFVVIGTLAALAVPAALGYVDADEAGPALRVVAIMVVVLLPLCVAALVLRTPEPPRVRRERVSLRQGIAVLARNAPMRRLVSAYLLNGVANGLPATLFLLFVANVLEESDKAGVLLFVYFLSGIVAVPVWVRLSYRFGKHRVWSGAMIWACVVFVWVPLLGPGDLWLFAAVCVLTGVSLGADLVLPASMQADVVDLDTLETGEQRTGVFFAIWGMVTKLALAGAVGLAFPLLDLAGFEDGARNSATALFALSGLYALAPVIFKAAAIVLMVGYPITAERQADVRRRIESESASHSASAAAGGTHR